MRPIRILLLTIAALATTLAVLALGLYAIARLSWSEARAAGWLTAGLGLPVEIGAADPGLLPATLGGSRTAVGRGERRGGSRQAA